MKERRAFVILVLISLFLSVSVFILGQRAIDGSDHKFCDLFNALVTSGPAPKPADPKKDPSRARSYVLYVKFKNLNHSLGCD